MDEGLILVGDAGGTNVRFALARLEAGRVSLSAIWKRPGRSYAAFTDALDEFLRETRPVFSAIALGLAGVVRDGRVSLLNRGWTIDVQQLASRLGVGQVLAVNDFVAMARSAPELGGDALRTLHAGAADPGASIVVGGPGTGFGLGALKASPQGWIVLGGEGGHQAFNPQTELEWKLSRILREEHGYVSNEMITAGAGFAATRDALRAAMGLAPADIDQAGVIEAARAGDMFAGEFCRIRARAVMIALGDFTLAANATGGVFVAGGVARHLEPWLREPSVLDCFYQRGVRSALIAPTPLHLIVSEAAPLIGVAHLWGDQVRRGWI